MLGFCPLMSAFDRSGKFGRSRRKDLGPSLCNDVCPFSCLNRCLGNGLCAAWWSGYCLLSLGFNVKLVLGAEWPSGSRVFWGERNTIKQQTTVTIKQPSLGYTDPYLQLLINEDNQTDSMCATSRIPGQHCSGSLCTFCKVHINPYMYIPKLGTQVHKI